MSNKQRVSSVGGALPENKPVKEKAAMSGQEVVETPQSSFASYREVIESLVFALFLAFLIKTFEAEAFVIPTGSMAPTLKGRHKDIHCQKCDFPFQVNASEEIDNSSNRSTSSRVVAGTCPQCGFTQYFKDDPVSFTGDRILVNKAAFDCRELRRWDVSVFRAPAEPKINFIKRIVGLPNERLKVEFGDIFVQKKLASGQYGEYEIVRKPLMYLRRMLQTVYDNDYPLVAAQSQGWPSRWMDESTSMNQGVVGWSSAEEGRVFSTTGRAVKPEGPEGVKQYRCQTPQAKSFDHRDGATQWLRYRHIIPMASDWFSLVDDKIPPEVGQTQTVRNNPQLITDLTAYNTGMSHDSGRNYDDYSRYIRKISPNDYRCSRSADSFGYNWTGDLALSCDLTFEDAAFTEQSELVFELVKGGQAFRCRIHPLDGRVTLEIPGVASYLAETAIYRFAAKKYHFQFMNIDEQMRFIINGKEVVFTNEGKYDHLCQPLPDGRPGVLPRDRDPNAQDLTPASIGAREIKVRLAKLKIQRDLYYIAMGNHVVDVVGDTSQTMFESGIRSCDRLFASPQPMTTEEEVTRFFSSPLQWKGYGKTHSAVFELNEGQYLALGDNSGLSHDSRLWGSETVPHYVDRKYLIGKAFFVYWPHGIPIPGTRVPLIPNVGKMRHID